MPASYHASYPTAIRTFTAWQDYTDIIWAFHPNEIHVEVTAIESTLGVSPQGAAATVAARLGAIEASITPLASRTYVDNAEASDRAYEDAAIAARVLGSPCGSQALLGNGLPLKICGGLNTGETDVNGLIHVAYSSAGFSNLVAISGIALDTSGNGAGNLPPYNYRRANIGVSTYDLNGANFDFTDSNTGDGLHNKVSFSWIVIGN